MKRMKPSILKMSACSISAALLFSGCEGMTPGESAATVGTSAGIAAGAIGAAAGLHTDQAVALGAGVGLLAAGITYAVAKHEATERQREVAEANARREYARHQAELRRKHVRYIAVKTSRTPESKGKTSCMVWDTQSEQVVGNTVYDTKENAATGLHDEVRQLFGRVRGELTPLRFQPGASCAQYTWVSYSNATVPPA